MMATISAEKHEHQHEGKSEESLRARLDKSRFRNANSACCLFDCDCQSVDLRGIQIHGTLCS